MKVKYKNIYNFNTDVNYIHLMAYVRCFLEPG